MQNLPSLKHVKQSIEIDVFQLVAIGVTKLNDSFTNNDTIGRSVIALSDRSKTLLSLLTLISHQYRPFTSFYSALLLTAVSQIWVWNEFCLKKKC